MLESGNARKSGRVPGNQGSRPLAGRVNLPWPTMDDAVDHLCKLARSLPDVEERVACAGTATEQRNGDLATVRLKLADVAAAGSGVEVGGGNWTTCRIPPAKAPSTELKRWVRENHALSAKPKVLHSRPNRAARRS